MAEPRMRPRFSHPLSSEAHAFFRALDRAIATGDGRIQANRFEAGAILRIRADERQFWSPALHLTIEADEQHGRVVHGRFSPSSPIWTAFVAIYLGLGCVATAAACYGGAQLALGRPPWAFAGVPIALALAAFTYGAAFIGQGLGADDMHVLRSFVERVADGVAPPRAADAADPGRTAEVG